MHFVLSILSIYILGRLSRVLWYRARRLASFGAMLIVFAGLLLSGC